jgi:hypothetical protein
VRGAAGTRWGRLACRRFANLASHERCCEFRRPAPINPAIVIQFTVRVPARPLMCLARDAGKLVSFHPSIQPQGYMSGGRVMAKAKPRAKNDSFAMGTARPERPKQVSLFISYTREDSDLAASVHAELLQLFAFTPVEIFRDVGIPDGTNYQARIDAQLDHTDILLVLLTDRLKPSFSYTGDEIGFFRHSIKNRPKIHAQIDRVVIPVCIGAHNPDTLHYIQSVQIDPQKVFNIEDAKTAQNPAATLLRSISDIVLNVLDIPRSPMQDDRLANSAARLYRLFSEYLEGRVSSESFPERKIIIRTDKPPAILSDGVDLSASTIELIGDSFQVFGFPEETNRQFKWPVFTSKMPSETRGTWVEGIRALVSGALHNGEENYHVVSTAKGDKAFRLFVSRIVNYVSTRTEIHIYIVQMIRRHYGNALTTRLLSAISLGLQFRFLFLEDDSKFRPTKFEFPLSMEASKELEAWKSNVTELLGQMDLLLREAKDQHLMDTDLLAKIWGPGGGQNVQQMMGVWDAARTRLYSAAQQILTSSEIEFAARKPPFTDALTDLCAKTEIMNREYTLRALKAIADEIRGPAGSASNPAVGGAETESPLEKARLAAA